MWSLPRPRTDLLLLIGQKVSLSMKNTFINNYRRFVKMSTFVTKSEEISSANLVFSSTKNIGESKFVMDDIKKALDRLAL